MDKMAENVLIPLILRTGQELMQCIQDCKLLQDKSAASLEYIELLKMKMVNLKVQEYKRNPSSVFSKLLGNYVG